MPDAALSERFALRPDREGYTVFDLWTGEPAVIATAPQTGLSEADARHTAAHLNRRALMSGDRQLPQ